MQYYKYFNTKYSRFNIFHHLKVKYTFKFEKIVSLYKKRKKFE